MQQASIQNAPANFGEVVHFDREIRDRRSRAAFTREADLRGGAPRRSESDDPAEVHDDGEAENVGIERLGGLDMIRADVRHYALNPPFIAHTRNVRPNMSLPFPRQPCPDLAV